MIMHVRYEYVLYMCTISCRHSIPGTVHACFLCGCSGWEDGMVESNLSAPSAEKLSHHHPNWNMEGGLDGSGRRETDPINRETQLPGTTLQLGGKKEVE